MREATQLEHEIRISRAEGTGLPQVAQRGLGFALSGETLTLLVAGLAEASVAGVLGFALLAVAWLLTAVGFRRQT